MAGASRIKTRCVRVCVTTASTGIALMPHSISGAKYTESESACYGVHTPESGAYFEVAVVFQGQKGSWSLVMSDCYWNAGRFFYFTLVIYPCACI